jgi:hypothetical protein
MSQNDNQQRVDDQNRQAARVRGQLEQLQQSLDRQEQRRQAQQRQEQQRQAQQRQEQQRQAQQRQEQQRQAQQRQEQQRRDSSSNAGNAARSDDPAKSSRDSQEALRLQGMTTDPATSASAEKTAREAATTHSHERDDRESAKISDELYASQSERWSSDSLDDAASHALRRDEEHQERQEVLGQIIDETNDPIERERLTLMRDIEHHSYAADQIDRIMDTSERCDRMAGTNITASPEMQRLRDRGAEHRSALSDTTQALKRHNAQHPPQGRSATEGPAKANTAQHPPDMSKPDRTDAATSNTPSPRLSFSERASARREAAEATGSALPKREYSATVQNQPSPSPAPARSNDESRTRSR